MYHAKGTTIVAYVSFILAIGGCPDYIYCNFTDATGSCVSFAASGSCYSDIHVPHHTANCLVFAASGTYHSKESSFSQGDFELFLWESLNPSLASDYLHAMFVSPTIPPDN